MNTLVKGTLIIYVLSYYSYVIIYATKYYYGICREPHEVTMMR